MQIIIDIPKYIADMCKECGCIIDADAEKVGKAIANGKPLPREHGRLKDIDAFISKVNADRKHAAYSRSWTADDVLAALNNSYAPTIIEEI